MTATAERALNEPVLTTVLRAVPGYVLILNRHRQILAANSELLRDLGLTNGDHPLGKRPGELLQCREVERSPSGCGTAEACRHCGAVLAILAAQAEQRSVDGHCQVVRRGAEPGTRYFRIRVDPLTLWGEPLLVCILLDTTAVKQKEMLEKLFFHDVRNLVTGLLGWTSELVEETDSEPAQRVAELVVQLRRELEEQYYLCTAERGEVKVKPSSFAVSQVLRTVETHCSGLACAKGRSLVMPLVDSEESLVTDQALLVRVLVNMTKNALEATPEGGQVELRFDGDETTVRFSVKNPGTMSQDVSSRIFQHEFSTKGEARGFGTYAMRLFGERYLGGRVSFVSSLQDGTSFCLELPATPQRALET